MGKRGEALEAKTDHDVTETTTPLTKQDRIDLTRSQLSTEQDEATALLDEFDLLEANIDTKDVRTLEKIHALEEEIENEKNKIKIKFIFKQSFMGHDPLRITE